MDLFTTIHTAATAPMIVQAAGGAGLFGWLNNMTSQATATLQAIILLIGIGIAVMGSIAGKGRIPSIIISILAGGLFAWGGIAGVFWVRDQAKATVESASPAIVEVYQFPIHEL